MATQTRRYTLVALLLLGFAAVTPRSADAQFLCSAGTRDGLECEGDDDCTGDGVCVIPLGVCTGGESDGFFCICPGSDCVAEPVCSDNASLGTCAGGVFQDLCCDLADNCFDGSPCASTQKVCIGGDFQGLPCVTNAHCPGSLCRSTGLYCSGGDNDSFSCFNTADCPGGECIGAAPIDTPGAATATPQAPTPTAPPTSTPVATVATPATPPTTGPTVTGTPGTAVPTGTSTPTRTPGITPDAPTPTPEPTRTPSVGRFASTMTDAAIGGFQLQVDVPTNQLVSFPVEGVFQVFGETFEFTRRRTSRVLNLTDPDGLPFSIAAGTVLLVIEATPRPSRPGGVIVRNEQGGSCAIRGSGGSPGSATVLLLGAALLLVARSFRRSR